MGIFDRMGTLLKANINDMISKAEDPEKILSQLILDMNSQLIDAKKQVAVAIADEKRLGKQLKNEEAKAKEWEGKAMMAVRAGRDDLARQALERQQQHATQTTAYQEQWQAQKNASDSLRGQLQQLNNKIEEAKRKKNLLIARARRAEAQKKIQETMHGLSDNSAFDAFDRMAEKVDQKEAEAAAQAEMAGMLTGSSLDDEFKALGASDAGTDDALAALKAKMSASAAPAALPPAAAPEPADAGLSDIEAELAALKAKAGVSSDG